MTGHIILIIEDDPEIREAICDALELDNYRLLVAENGREGVQIAKREDHIDLILCDVMMPELDGYGVLLELSQNKKKSTIPFIFLTAKAAREDIRKGMTLGADDYLTKPFSTQELLEAVSSRLKKRELITGFVEEKIENIHRYINLTLPHELRTPLTGIMGYLYLLRDGYDGFDSKAVEQMLGKMDEFTVRLYKLIENYLAYAQLQVLAVNPDLIQMHKRNGLMRHPSATISVVVDQIAYQNDASGRVEKSLENGTIVIFEDHFKKVLEELLKNSIYFSEPETIIEVNASKADGKYIVEFKNTGRGMTAEQIERIGVNVQFDRDHFEQQGAGLGLVIARTITEIYEGSLEIESTPGHQTIARLTLPIAT